MANEMEGLVLDMKPVLFCVYVLEKHKMFCFVA